MHLPLYQCPNRPCQSPRFQGKVANSPENKRTDPKESTLDTSKKPSSKPNAKTPGWIKILLLSGCGLIGVGQISPSIPQPNPIIINSERHILSSKNASEIATVTYNNDYLDKDKIELHTEDYHQIYYYVKPGVIFKGSSNEQIVNYLFEFNGFKLIVSPEQVNIIDRAFWNLARSYSYSDLHQLSHDELRKGLMDRLNEYAKMFSLKNHFK
jgi:hypothetical protein